MKPSERRAIMQAAKILSSDKRAILLVGTSLAERSEIAARYDHLAEISDLDSGRAPTAAEHEALATDLWRGRVVSALAERGGYRDIVSRYLSGRIRSAGMDRAIQNIEAEISDPDDEDVQAAWSESRRARREYLASRYGL